MISIDPIQTAILLPYLAAIKSPRKAVIIEGRKIEAAKRPKMFPLGDPKYAFQRG